MPQVDLLIGAPAVIGTNTAVAAEDEDDEDDELDDGGGGDDDGGDGDARAAAARRVARAARSGLRDESGAAAFVAEGVARVLPRPFLRKSQCDRHSDW